MTAATGSEQTVVVPAGADMVVAHAEGHSWVALRAGEALTGKDDAEEVYLRTTGGILQDAKGGGPIRSVTLRRGSATFRVVGDAPPRFVTVIAFTGGPGPTVELPIEFV